MFKLLLYSLLIITPCFAHNIDNEFDLETNLLINSLNVEDALATRNTEQPIPEIACISLGSNCVPALHFKRCNIVNAFYPFDFIVTPFDALCMLLETRFQCFLAKDALESLEEKCGNHLVIKNNITKCEFLHDFGHLNDYPLVAEKYQRRIDRFYKTIETAKYVYFFRTGLKKRQTLKLNDLLHQTFPKLNFTLIALTSKHSVKHPCQISGIREFYDHGYHRNKPFKWNNKESIQTWDRIFSALKLI